MLGGYIAIPGEHNPNYVLAAAYLIVAGADPGHIVKAFEASRRKASAPRPSPR